MNDQAKFLPGTGRGTSAAGGGGLAQGSAPPSSALRAATSPFQGGSVRDQFPAIANWHYLDSAATAQKPQAVIDAITSAYARDYATVHRGIYQRSSDMTAAYEAARSAAAALIGGHAGELVFTRGATEAINLVARVLPREGRNRVLLSALEHHSNI
ncbi:MAG: aminotransferase class V-fold PLP-dependent enzyme, partial [Sphingomonas sp.]|nr:aminotransferase class V-fold PLP-dependent enzyme [Sphingomonas sp.]